MAGNIGKFLTVTCTIVTLIGSEAGAQEPSDARKAHFGRLIAKRKAGRAREDAAWARRAERAASERRDLREHAAAMAPVLEARREALAREQLIAADVLARRAQAAAAFEQAEAARRMAAAISYRAWLDRGRRRP